MLKQMQILMRDVKSTSSSRNKSEEANEGQEIASNCICLKTLNVDTDEKKVHVWIKLNQSKMQNALYKSSILSSSVAPI